jgi:hypothetical protein
VIAGNVFRDREGAENGAFLIQRLCWIDGDLIEETFDAGNSNREQNRDLIRTLDSNLDCALRSSERIAHRRVYSGIHHPAKRSGHVLRGE